MATAVAAGAAALSRTGAAAQPSSAPRRRFAMNFGPHLGMFGDHASDEADQIAFFADQGFTAFEDNGMRGRTTELQEKIARALQKHNVTMGVFVAADGAFGPPILTHGGKAELDKFLSDIRDSVEVAKRVNAKWMTVVPGTVHNHIDMGYQTANVIDALKRAAEIFEPHGLVMVLEPLNWRDHPNQFLRYSPQAYAICKAVASPACKILFDIYHQQVSEGNLIENIDRCWDEIAYFQIGDNPGRCEPTTGEINYANVFRHIHAKGFTGVMGMEHGVKGKGKEGELALIEAYAKCDPGHGGS